VPNILHRLTIDAPPDRVADLASGRAGIAEWWTAHPVSGNDDVGGEISVRFSDGGEPAATFEVTQRGPDEIVWRCVAGPADWIDTRVVFELKPTANGGTTLLFGHRGWKHESEFMHGCSTNWAAYLMSLKSGAEGRGFNPYPCGEISRWR